MRAIICHSLATIFKLFEFLVDADHRSHWRWACFGATLRAITSRGAIYFVRYREICGELVGEPGS